MTKRRDLLIWGGALVAGVGLSTWIRNRRAPLTFTPLETPAGFRMLDGQPGGASGIGAALFAGLDAPRPQDTDRFNSVSADPCAALFGTPDDTLPVAVFSDYFCPYCARHSRVLEELAANRNDIRLILHEWPILTPRSEELARLALAARKQGDTWAAHHWLMTHALPPGPAGARRFAEALALDADQLMRDAGSAETSRHIATSGALARLFRLSGTPGTVAGRTLILGAVEPDVLDQIIDLELSDPHFCG